MYDALACGHPLNAARFDIAVETGTILVNQIAGGLDGADSITLVNTASQLTLNQALASRLWISPRVG